MSLHLVPCVHCARHVRVAEIRCPFCATALPDDLRAAPAPRVPPAGLARSALVAFGLIAAAETGSACGDDAGAIGEVYGGPPPVDPGGQVLVPIPPPTPPPPQPPPATLEPAPPALAPPPVPDPVAPPSKRARRPRGPITAPPPPPDPGNPVQAYGAPPIGSPTDP